MDAPIINEATLASNFTNEGGAWNKIRLLKNISGMWLLEECRRAWTRGGYQAGYAELCEAALKARPLTAILDPDDPSFLSPGEMPAKIAAFCRRTSQPMPQSPGAIARSIFESLALKYRTVLETLQRILGRPFRKLHIVGGGSRNAVLCQFTADAVGLPVIAGPEEATAVGNVLLQAMALGHLGSPAELREVVRRSFEPRTYLPASREPWNEAAARYMLHGLDWKRFGRHLTHLDWKWVAAAVFFDILSYVCQAVRWNFVLAPLGPPSLYRSTQAIYVGLFTNEVLPLRGGELVRAYLVSQWTEIEYSVVLSSVAIERLLDGIWLAVGFGITALLLPLPHLVRHGAQILGVVVLAGTVLLVVTLAEGLKVTHALEQTPAGHRGLLARLLHFFDRLIEGLQRIGHSASLYWAAAASLALLLIQILAVWALMKGYGLQYSFWVASGVLLILHLGVAIPNAPGNIGSFQFFCVVGLTLFGVDKRTAGAFSLVAFLTLTGPLLILGFVALIFSGASLREIRHHVRSKLNSR
ncbi:MAG: flippase-like domain-containing protein [Acidobacteria bacterium]|nr:flippase-like domain-containing protein [Acidobacteriota bacterium]